MHLPVLSRTQLPKVFSRSDHVQDKISKGEKLNVLWYDIAEELHLETTSRGLSDVDIHEYNWSLGGVGHFEERVVVAAGQELSATLASTTFLT